MTRRFFIPFLSTLLFASPVVRAAEESGDQRLFELRTYWAAPGKLDELHARFRDHTVRLLAKHGITSVGYWTPAENQERKVVFLLAFPDKDSREKLFKEFGNDPEWQAVMKASEAGGKLVEKVESQLLKLTDFSPPVKPETGGSPSRVYELRVYTATTGKLDNLLARFREHTVKLFAKHGMKNFGYWTPAPGQEGAENTLIYLLAHESVAAKDASFKAFREDPVWIEAKRASEEKAGGSLTVPDGVKSEVLVPTDYSPTK